MFIQYFIISSLNLNVSIETVLSQYYLQCTSVGDIPTKEMLFFRKTEASILSEISLLKLLSVNNGILIRLFILINSLHLR